MIEINWISLSIHYTQNFTENEAPDNIKTKIIQLKIISVRKEFTI